MPIFAQKVFGSSLFTLTSLWGLSEIRLLNFLHLSQQIIHLECLWAAGEHGAILLLKELCHQLSEKMIQEICMLQDGNKVTEQVRGGKEDRRNKTCGKAYIIFRGSSKRFGHLKNRRDEIIVLSFLFPLRAHLTLVCTTL